MMEYLSALVNRRSTNKCSCGQKKPSWKTFCYHCYDSLPEQIKRDLYKRVGKGYEEAYATAKAYLKGDTKE